MALGDAYVTIGEMRDEFGIGDADDDPGLVAALTSASNWVTTFCERDFNVADAVSARTFHLDRRQIAHVDDISTTTGLIVATDSGDDGTFETTWASTEYQLEPLNGIHAGRVDWPYTRIRFVERYINRVPGWRPVVQVTALWGWPAVPEPVVQATKIQAARIFKRRYSPEGVLGGGENFGSIRVGTKLDPDVAMLLDAYRKNPVLVA